MVGKTQRIIVTGLIALWLSGLGYGIRTLQAYGTGEGRSDYFALRYPQDSQIKVAAADRPSLLVFLHPECPCSRSTLESLDQLLARATVKPEVYVVFVVPKGWTTARAKTALWLRASRMTGVTPVIDRDGQEAKRFGASTSGQVYAYTPGGSLAFSGGITVARGHNGDNEGRALLEDYLTKGGDVDKVAKYRVFGCALFDAKQSCVSHEAKGRKPGSRKKAG